ncbi:MAG: M48 family metallopeptidase [Deltaproteobacteria bacterium]|nr:M48 family metallopeptidase [Deltaproteobacteria bacterium]
MTTVERREIAEALWPDPEAVPPRVVRCRHCGTRNRVAVGVAVLEPTSCRCGSCGGRLFLSPDEPLESIAPAAYEHPLDRRTLDALQAVPGFPAFLRWAMKHANERAAWLQAMSGAVRCDRAQFPELVALLDRARRALDLSWEPALFLGESPFVNARTMGVDRPVLIVHSALLDTLDDDEVVAVLGHELGHLHSDHVLYQTLARLLVRAGALRGGLLLSWPLELALLRWSRCAELTCDRAALLASRDLAACLRVHLKMAGGFRPGTRARTRLALAPFLAQARELETAEAGSLLDNVLVTLFTAGRTHPFAAWRAMHLVQWVEKGSFLDVLAGDYPRVDSGAAGDVLGEPALA